MLPVKVVQEGVVMVQREQLQQLMEQMEQVEEEVAVDLVIP